MSEKQGPAAGPPAEPIEIRLPPENVELFHAIMEIANNPESDRIRLYAALTGSVFLVPLSGEPPSTEAPQGDEVNIDVLTLTGPEGELALPVFTHEDAVRQWIPAEQPTPATMTFSGLSLFQLAAASPMQFILINPAGPFGGQVSRPEFEALAQEVLPEIAAMLPPQDAAGQSSMTGALQNVYVDALLEPLPETTEERLRELFEENAAVRGAYLFLMQVGENSPPRLALGIDVEGAAGQWVIPQVNRLFSSEPLSFEPYETPELVLLENIPGSQSVRETVVPLFERPGETIGTAESEERQETIDDDNAPAPDEPAFAAGSDEIEPADDAPRRRSLWPFRRQR